MLIHRVGDSLKVWLLPVASSIVMALTPPEQWFDRSETIVSSVLAVAAILVGFQTVALSVSFNMRPVTSYLSRLGRLQSFFSEIRASIGSCFATIVLSVAFLVFLPEKVGSASDLTMRSGAVLFVFTASLSLTLTLRMLRSWIAAIFATAAGTSVKVDPTLRKRK